MRTLTYVPDQNAGREVNVIAEVGRDKVVVI